MKYQQLIDKYLFNKLNKDEKEEFDQLILSDEKFKKELEFYLDLSAIIEKEEADNLKQMLNKRSAPLQNSTKALYLLLIILGLVGLLFVYKKVATPTSASQYASYFKPYPNTFYPITRSEDISPYWEAFNAYENKAYSIAVQEFDDILADSISLPILFYKGISLASINKEDEAIATLLEAAQGSPPYSVEARWYLALIYYKINRIEQAKGELNEYITKTEYDTNKKLAQKLLDNLK